jgi:hypothetical protein
MSRILLVTPVNLPANAADEIAVLLIAVDDRVFGLERLQ